MNEKRYAIVRVDKNCPSHFGVENWKVCRELCYAPTSCDNSLYGDTKDQLIKKVQQALELCMKKGYRTITSEEYAKFIVEFLGVE